MVPCKFGLILSLFGLGPSFKGHGSNLWFSTNTIILLYILTLDLRLSFKVALSYFEGTKNEKKKKFTFENERLHPRKLITILQGNWHQPI
jgi:hypothetical protein